MEGQEEALQIIDQEEPKSEELDQIDSTAPFPNFQTRKTNNK